jgi:DNA-binding transcriptional LysR family regulator
MKQYPDLDFNLFKCLDALLNEESVTKAACRLGVKQPAMSAALVRLREVFKDPLLVREHRKMTPTKHALALKDPVNRLIKDISRLLEDSSFDALSGATDLSSAPTSPSRNQASQKDNDA